MNTGKWRPVGTFSDSAACVHAAKVLGKDATNAICVATSSKDKK